jgi:ribosomal protein S18 acetylase RimI-like enzyme
MITIRRGVAADAPALAAFAERTFVETFGDDPRNRPDDLAAHRASAFGAAQQGAELVDPDMVTLVAERGGALVAFAQIRRGPPPPCVTEPDAIELQRFYVDRAAHGTGLAQRLMAAVHGAARGAGAGYLWLGVWEHNPRAIAFYTKSGFRDVGSHAFVLGTDPQTDRVMVAAVPNE